MSDPGLLAFGGFVLDRARQRVVHGDGSPVILTPRLFSALLLFVERAGELLDKESMMAALWPGLVVEENNLNPVVHALRRVLGDDGSRFIETVPRRGFRFVAAVTVLPDAPGGRDELPSPRNVLAAVPAPVHDAVVAATSVLPPADGSTLAGLELGGRDPGFGSRRRHPAGADALLGQRTGVDRRRTGGPALDRRDALHGPE
jgi:DNA-binding winged helix-turn-helix (wHTH) protein